MIAVFSVKVLYLLGAMSLSMALQLDRHGLWNLLGPSLFALGIMAVAWVRPTCISLYILFTADQPAAKEASVRKNLRYLRLKTAVGGDVRNVGKGFIT